MGDISSVVCLCEYLITYQSERRASEIGVKLLVFFTFFINFFFKTLIKSIFYCQTVPLEHLLLMYVVKIVYQASLLSFPSWVSLAIFCFRSMSNGNFLFSSASIVIGRRFTDAYELRVMAAVELYVNATYYAQHPTLKLVYGKSQLVIVGKLFSS